MMQLLSRRLCWFSVNKNLLKNSGIVNPNIVRNLRYLSIHSAPQNSMRADSTTPLPTPTPNPTRSPAPAPSWPSQVHAPAALPLPSPSSMTPSVNKKSHGETSTNA